jgi:hypothetical protein
MQRVANVQLESTALEQIDVTIPPNVLLRADKVIR